MKDYDLFISHAGEDKANFVEPLVTALEARGLKVWFDAHQILLGDDFREKMDEGLRRSRFGVVVLSPWFLKKYWTKNELSALFTQERIFNEKRILPVVHDLTPKEFAENSPQLAARAAAYSSDGPAVVADKIYEVVEKSRGAVKLQSPLYGVPQTRSVNFLGRERELATIGKLLERKGPVRIAVSLEGLPGIGKTELALQLVHRLAHRGGFPGGIFWFNAKDPDLVPTWGSTIADGLNIPGGRGRMLERAIQAVQDVSRRVAPTLLVLDNVDSWNTEERPQPLPEGAHLRYLLTSRKGDLGGRAFEHVKLLPLDATFTRQFLEDISGRELSGLPGWQELVDYLGGHTLAVEQAGVFLRFYPEESPMSYLEELRAGGRIESEVSEYVLYNRTVRQAFQTLWDRLDEPIPSLWQLAACFEPEFVTIELSEAVGFARQDRLRLHQLHLIERDEKGRWRMHRLTREFGRRNGSLEQLASARRSFVIGCAKLAQTIQLETGYRIYLENRPHLDEAVRTASDVLDPTNPEDPRVYELQSAIETGRHSAGDLAGAKELAEKALESAVEMLGEDHPAAARRRSNLALVLKDLGDPHGAKQLLLRALSSVNDSLGHDHTQLVDWRANLAMVERDLGDLEVAKTLLEESLREDLRTLGENHPTVARRLSRLGLVLKDMGDFRGAEEFFEKALASDLRSLGEDHPTVARRRSDLALVLIALGAPVRAKALFEKALTSARQNFGDEHLDVVEFRSNLASLAQDLEGLEEAEEYLRKDLASAREAVGDHHPNVAMIRSNLASVLADLGETQEARELAREALEAAEQLPVGSVVRTRVEAAMQRVLAH